MVWCGVAWCGTCVLTVDLIRTGALGRQLWMELKPIAEDRLRALLLRGGACTCVCILCCDGSWGHRIPFGGVVDGVLEARWMCGMMDVCCGVE